MWLFVAEWDGKRMPGAPHLGVRVVLLMPTLTQFKRVHGELLDAENNGTWKFLGGEYNHTDHVLRFPGGSWIRIVSAEQRSQLAGLRCDVICVDECDDVDIECFDALAGPWLSEPFSLQITVFAGTPRRGRYGLLYRQHRRGLDRHPHCYTSHATYLDVPEHVDRAYVELERANVSPELFRREWLCDFDSAEGLVYPMFDEGFHVREADPRTQWTEFLVGVDHGYEDPGVMLLIAVAGSGVDATCHVLREIYATKQIEDWWLAKVSEVHGWAKALAPRAAVRWYCDPSRPDRIAALAKRGASIRDVNNAIEDGVSCVANRLAIRETSDGKRYARLYVSPECRNTIREFGLYRRKRDPRNKDRILDDIADRDNHCFPAGTLVQTETGARQIERVAVGERVQTRNGPRRVSRLWNYRRAPIWRVHLGDGTAVDATPDHRFWTVEQGWTRLDGLRPGMRLLQWHDPEPDALSFSSSTGSLTDGTQTRRAENCGYTLPATGEGPGSRGCTVPSGNTTVDPFPRAFTSTTRTKTPSTTTSATLSVCRGTITSRTTGGSCTLETPNERCDASKSRGRAQPRGTEAKLAGFGTSSTGDKSRRRCSLSPKHALSAGAATRPRLDARTLDSARTTARPQPDERWGSTTSSPDAPGVEASFDIRASSLSDIAARYVEALAVEDLGTDAAVFCLSVDEDHEFFANGVLVSNCTDALRYPLFSRFGQLGTPPTIGTNRVFPY